MKKLILALGFILAIGCSAAQTLIVGQSGLPVTLDTGQDRNSLIPTYQIVENLVFFEQGSGELGPGLATAWTPNSDATSWTLDLREDVTFHDGTPFNAEAVKFNPDRWNDPDFEYGFRDQGKAYVPWGWIFGGVLGDGSILQAVSVLDEHTVELTLTESVAFLPALLASSYFGMHSPTAIKEAGPDYGSPRVGAVGTGPFTFVDWVEGSQVELERAEHYWGDEAKVERIVFLGFEEPTVRLAQLKSGTIDIALNMAADDLEEVERDPEPKAAIANSSMNTAYVGFQQSHAPFGDQRVRKAIAHAIDRDAIVEAFYGGLGSPASQFQPPAIWGRSEVEPYSYNPELAGDLLAEAGYPDGFSTEFWYLPVSRPYYPTPAPIAETIATYLADVGIDVELRTVDWSTYLDEWVEGNLPFYMLGGTADYADPHNLLSAYFGSGATDQLGWNNPRVLELINEGRAATTREEREEVYAELSNLIYEEVPALPIAHTRVLNATLANIEGFVPPPISGAVLLRTVTKN